MSHPLDAAARRIFEAAISEDRCGELLECLFDGGAPTVDGVTGRLVLASAAMLAGLSDTPPQ
jgi:hypothetical protein